jgi:hypothetical protein
MNKCIHVVCVNNYRLDIACKTVPYLQFYAKRIGADFNLITDRKYPEWPVTYEKMQIYDLGKKYNCNILLDCDILLDHKMYDITEIVPSNCIGTWMVYDPAITIKEDEFIKLDGSDRIPVTNCIVTRQSQHEFWKPFDSISMATALSRMKREFVIDEYCVGRNTKKNNFSIVGVIEKRVENKLFFHGNITTESNSEFFSQLNNIK